MSSTYWRSIAISQEEKAAFEAVLQSNVHHIFSPVKGIVLSYLAKNYHISLAAARRSAINSYFWQMVENTAKPCTDIKHTVNDILLKLTKLTHHYHNNANISVSSNIYLDNIWRNTQNSQQ